MLNDFHCLKLTWTGRSQRTDERTEGTGMRGQPVGSRQPGGCRASAGRVRETASELAPCSADLPALSVQRAQGTCKQPVACSSRAAGQGGASQEKEAAPAALPLEPCSSRWGPTREALGRTSASAEVLGSTPVGRTGFRAGLARPSERMRNTTRPLERMRV
jgi:hypothetical protein